MTLPGVRRDDVAAVRADGDVRRAVAVDVTGRRDRIAVVVARRCAGERVQEILGKCTRGERGTEESECERMKERHGWRSSRVERPILRALPRARRRLHPSPIPEHAPRAV